MQFISRYSKHLKVTLSQEGEKSRTRTSEKDSCDINKIMERFKRTGLLPNVQTVPARYGENVAMDFATAQNLIIEAREQFMSLPALTRKYFFNDPQIYLQALTNPSPETTQDLLKLGIIVERKTTDSDVLKEINAGIKNLKPEAKI